MKNFFSTDKISFFKKIIGFFSLVFLFAPAFFNSNIGEQAHLVYKANNPNSPADPTGFIYNTVTGELVTGGTFSVTPPMGGDAAVFENITITRPNNATTFQASGDGVTYGFYSWIPTGTTPGIYTIDYTPPTGFEIDPDCAAIPTAVDMSSGTLFMIGDTPFFLGQQKLHTPPGPPLNNPLSVIPTIYSTTSINHITYTDCSVNPYHLTFDYDPTTNTYPIYLNNIPVRPIDMSSYTDFCTGTLVSGNIWRETEALDSRDYLLNTTTGFPVRYALVTAYDEDNQVIGQCRSNADGSFGFDFVAGTDFRLQISELPHRFGVFNVGMSSSTSYSAQIFGTAPLSDIDVGLMVLPTSSVAGSMIFEMGNRVWRDHNRNGIQEAGEPGLEGVQIDFHQGGSGTATASTITNARGEYYFVDGVLEEPGVISDTDINPAASSFQFRLIYSSLPDYFTSGTFSESNYRISPAEAGSTATTTIISSLLSSFNDTYGVVNRLATAAGVSQNQIEHYHDMGLYMIHDPSITATTTTGTATIGTTFDFNIAYTNLGDEVTMFYVSTTVPVGTTYSSAGSTGSWSCPDGSVAGTLCLSTTTTQLEYGDGGVFTFEVNVLSGATGTIDAVFSLVGGVITCEDDVVANCTFSTSTVSAELSNANNSSTVSVAVAGSSDEEEEEEPAPEEEEEEVEEEESAPAPSGGSSRSGGGTILPNASGEIFSPSCTVDNFIFGELRSTNASEVMYGATADLSSALWQPLQNGRLTIPSLSLNPDSSGRAYIYARFRTPAGYTSDIVRREVLVDTVNRCGAVIFARGDGSSSGGESSTPLTDTLSGQNILSSSGGEDQAVLPAACEFSLDEITYDVYIVNPDGSERHMNTTNVQVVNLGGGYERLQFEDSLGDFSDYDYNDLVLEVGRHPENRLLTVQILSVSASWHHQIRMKIFYNGLEQDDMLLWADSHSPVEELRVIPVEQVLSQCAPPIVPLTSCPGCEGILPILYLITPNREERYMGTQFTRISALSGGRFRVAFEDSADLGQQDFDDMVFEISRNCSDKMVEVKLISRKPGLRHRVGLLLFRRGRELMDRTLFNASSKIGETRSVSFETQLNYCPDVPSARRFRLLPDVLPGQGGGPEEELVAVCEPPYLKAFIERGQDNVPSEVRRLQKFLREKEGFRTVRETGVYDTITFSAVIRFQERYAADVLSPWRLTRGTGFVYESTRAKVNEIACDTGFVY